MNYYNPRTEEVKTTNQLMIIYNATIFNGVAYTDTAGDIWYPLIADIYPADENILTYVVDRIEGDPDSGFTRFYRVESYAPVVIPMEITAFQAKAILIEDGYYDAVEAYMSSGNATAMQKLAWNSAAVFERQSPTVRDIAMVLGLDDAALDDMFIRAKEIKA